MTGDEPCYLYGFIRTGGPALPELTGVFGAPVQLLPGDGIAAVVSPLPDQPLRPGRGDVFAHSDVLQALLADHDVVPANFGSVYPNGFSIDELPGAQRRSLKRLVDDLAGRIEFQVKATYVQDAITRALVDSDGKLRRLRGARQDYSTQLALGTRFAEVLARRRQADESATTKRLARLTERVWADPPIGEWGVFRLSFLVRRDRERAFVQALEEMSGELAPMLTLTWVGPLPPYSFAQQQSGRKAG